MKKTEEVYWSNSGA